VVAQESVDVRLDTITSPPLAAIIVERYPTLDLALLQLTDKSQHWTPAPLGIHNKLQVGSLLTGIGYPQSDLAIVPTGKITARNTIVHGVFKPWWQTSLALNPGNSGGPVFGNVRGRVVGIAVAFHDNTQLISYVIPLDAASDILSDKGAKYTPAGPCADPPPCRDESHGHERWEIDTYEEGWSDWSPYPTPRLLWCNELKGTLHKKFPDAELHKVREDSDSRENGYRHFEFRNYCQFHREEGNLYREAKGIECVRDDTSD
jgi:hypothetical protein